MLTRNLRTARLAPAKRRRKAQQNYCREIGSRKASSLLLVGLGLVVHDGEVAQLVGVLVAGDHVKVVAELLLLEVLLGQVLEVTLRERRLGGHRDARLRPGRRKNKKEETSMVNSRTAAH